jgi:hypothetical protein
MNIHELENWLKRVKLPAAPIYLNPSPEINNVEYFLESHFSSL